MKDFEISTETIKQYGSNDPGASGECTYVMAKNLQIGDWVSYLGDPVMVVSLSLKDEESIGIISPLKTIEKVREGDVRPIHITEDIIDWACEQDNRKDAEWYFEEFYQPGLWRLEITGTLNNIDVNISYVHELQHVLRVVGLSDMANNLKVD